MHRRASIHTPPSQPANAASPTPHRLFWLLSLTLLLVLGGCASQSERLADGDEIPAAIARIPNAVPKFEPLSKSGNPESYVVFGKRYYPKRDCRGHVERGLASWYGKPFHGRKTSSGDIYDMHAMTAAHKTLPLPSYARVTNLENGRSVVVRVNDRGPFHAGRIIDLSYTAAVKLGLANKGTAKVEVRAIDPRHRKRDRGPFLAGTRGATHGEASQALGSRATTPKHRSKAPATALDQPPALTRESGSGTNPSSARALAARERPRSPTQGRTLYLQVGAFGDQANAERLRKRLTTRLSPEEIAILEPQRSGPALYKVRIGPLASERDADRISQELSDLGLSRPHRVWN